MMFLCELIHNGIVKECFYRNGTDAYTVKEDLEAFCWGPGKWRITPA